MFDEIKAFNKTNECLGIEDGGCYKINILSNSLRLIWDFALLTLFLLLVLLPSARGADICGELLKRTLSSPVLIREALHLVQHLLKCHEPEGPSTVLVFIYLWLQVNFVRGLLKLPDFSDDVRNLKNKTLAAGC